MPSNKTTPDKVSRQKSTGSLHSASLAAGRVNGIQTNNTSGNVINNRSTKQQASKFLQKSTKVAV
jgi:hypothetical protein